LLDPPRPQREVVADPAFPPSGIGARDFLLPRFLSLGLGRSHRAESVQAGVCPPAPPLYFRHGAPGLASGAVFSCPQHVPPPTNRSPNMPRKPVGKFQMVFTFCCLARKDVDNPALTPLSIRLPRIRATDNTLARTKHHHAELAAAGLSRLENVANCPRLADFLAIALSEMYVRVTSSAVCREAVRR